MKNIELIGPSYILLHIHTSSQHRHCCLEEEQELTC